MDIRRRSFLTFLGTLPVVSDWMRIFGSTHTKSVKSVKKQEPKDEEWEAKFRAVETLRVINTAEKWHFVATKQHSPLGQLHQTESYKKLIEIAGQHRFKRAFDNFPPDGRIELQGYDILVETTADRSRYLATVSMKGPTYTFVFASDESGMIYEGRPLGNGNGASEANWSLDNLIADKHPLGQLQKPEPRRNTLLAMISPSRILDFLLSALPPPVYEWLPLLQ